MAQDKPDLGEQALSKVAEMGISSQLDEVDEINVDIRTDPGKLVQGEVDSVAIEGKGMVMKKELRMEKLEMNTSAVAINPMSALFGNIELTHPTDAEAQAVLTETDLNRAINSDYLRGKMKNLQLQVKDKPITVDVQQAEIHLPEKGKMSLSATVLQKETKENKQLSATVIPKVGPNGESIDLEVLSAAGEGLNPEFIAALFEQLLELLNLRNLEISGMSLRLKKFDVEKGKLILHAKTRIERFPST
jgi:hypothetical protein